MNHLQQSSGNFVADKRADYARQCAEMHDYEVAVDVMKQALELAPLWAPGWYGLGEYLEKASDPLRAHEAYTQALKLSDTDYLGAELKVAYLAKIALNEVPLAYTQALFDDYANRFDVSLIKRLNYVAPEQLAALLRVNFGSQCFATAIDLGCGTGLMGAQLRNEIGYLTGIDVSRSMLEKAAEKHLYDQLINEDISQALAEFKNIDLVMSADVFIYMANLEQVFTAISKCLSQSGLFLFSIEVNHGDEPWRLLNSMRHAHSAKYVEALLSRNNLTIVGRKDTVIRSDGSKPVAGLLYLAQKQTDD